MSIVEGQRLGPYEIVSRIGAGGMGEVWRARDPRLARSVAIKILPAGIAADPQRRVRFEREATSLSQLVHPNICTVFDVGDDYLVMELLEGESLADRLSRGPLPIEQVLRIGIEISSALHYAHRSGIVHRDLKPANVMLTKSGAKLLDFGLAKAVGDDPPAAGAETTTVRPLTEEGTIVGTYQYMSPEQLTAGLVDHRSDIFALGALLYEMITARRAFDGATRNSVVTSILTRDPPPLTQSNAETPPPLQRVVTTCLAKDPDERWQSAHDVALELKALRDGISSQVPHRSLLLRHSLRIATLLLIAVAGLSAGYFLARRSPSPAVAVVHLGVIPPPGLTIQDFIIAPRGDRVAILTHDQSHGSVWIRDLTTDALHEVPDSEGVIGICFSPDGNSIAFITKGRLFKASAGGGPAVMIADGLGFTPGISWGPSDTLIFARDDDGGINRISATAGGAWTKITSVARAAGIRGYDRHMWPSFLPDGRHFLFLVDAESPFIAVGSIDPAERPRRVLDDVASGAQYAAGQLLFVRASTLMAQPFDLDRLQVTGPAQVIAEKIADADFRRYVFSAAGERALAYSTFDPRSRIHLLDRSGKEIAAFGDPADWVSVSWSPDGRRAILERAEGDQPVGKLWLADLSRGVFNEFSSSRFSCGGLWSSDGNEVLYQTDSGTFEKRPDGGGERRLPILSGASAMISTWAGDWVAAEVGSKSALADVMAISISTGKQVPVANSPAWENVASFTGDGKWIAYWASGKIIVQPFPPNGSEFTVSSNPGGYPRWRGDGRELYYWDYSGHLLAVPIQVKDGAIDAGSPQTLFTVRLKTYKNRIPYDVAPDGQRFLLNVQDSYERAAHVVLNWTSALH